MTAATLCPRCDARLIQTYDAEPPECIQCGYVDYDYIPPALIPKPNAIILPYIGSEAALQGITARLSKPARGKQIGLVEQCPLSCGALMHSLRQDGRRMISGDAYHVFRCPQKHRIYVSTNYGGWR